MHVHDNVHTNTIVTKLCMMLSMSLFHLFLSYNQASNAHFCFKSNSRFSNRQEKCVLSQDEKSFLFTKVRNRRRRPPLPYQRSWAFSAVQYAYEYTDDIIHSSMSGLSRFQPLYDAITVSHDADAQRCHLVAEKKNIRHISNEHTTAQQLQSPVYEKVLDRNLRTVAALSKSPIIFPPHCATLKKCAEDHWGEHGQRSSRFTYQRPGNSELHVEDLPEEALRVVNEALLNRIYPWVRNVFNVTNGSLSVYDALIIRYNATEALLSNADTSQDIGAGQPLHRDLGMFSVNIALSENSDYEGGGTFFEKLTESIESSVIRPEGLGYGVAHSSSERHAGSATYAGVRDIMVFFITLSPITDVEVAMRCKGQFQTDLTFEKEEYYRAAIACNPNDSEAWQFLAMSMISNAQNSSNQNHIKAAIPCLERARNLSPFDARVHNNLGIALQRLLVSSENASFSSCDLQERIGHHFHTAVSILEKSSKAGCDVRFDECSSRLNLGLLYANEDRFQEAMMVLNAPCMNVGGGIQDSKQKNEVLERILSDAASLRSFCKSRDK